MSSNMNVNPNAGVKATEGLDNSLFSATVAQPVSSDTSKSWFEAMAKAWGSAMDHQAGVITDMASKVGSGGQDNPSAIVNLQAESLRFGFLSQSEATSVNAVGQGQQAMARKE